METNRESKVVIDKHMRKFGLEAYRSDMCEGALATSFCHEETKQYTNNLIVTLVPKRT
jgi:hypothetical protein